MLSTRNLFPTRWYTANQVSLILWSKYHLKCSFRKVYKILRDNEVIDENNRPLPPYDDYRVDIESVRLEHTYTRSQKHWHDKVILSEHFIKEFSKMVAKVIKPTPPPEFDL